MPTVLRIMLHRVLPRPVPSLGLVSQGVSGMATSGKGENSPREILRGRPLMYRTLPELDRAQRIASAPPGSPLLVRYQLDGEIQLHCATVAQSADHLCHQSMHVRRPQDIPFSQQRKLPDFEGMPRSFLLNPAGRTTTAIGSRSTN